MNAFTTKHYAVVRAVALAGLALAGIASILATTSSSNAPVQRSAACAGRDQQVSTGSVVQLDGSCSELSDHALDDDFLQVSWLIMAKPAGSVAALSDRNVINPSFTADVDGEYRIQLLTRATSEFTFDEGFVTVTASSANARPVAHAGYNRHVKLGDSFTLDGSRGYDADGDLLTFTWSLNDPVLSGATLTDPDNVRPVVAAPVPAAYLFALQVNDGSQDSDRDFVQVRVTMAGVNACPNTDAGPDQRVATGSLVSLDGSGSADPDADPITYTWRMLWRPEGSNAALDDPTDNPAPSFNADVDGAYVIKLTADDQGTFTGSRANCLDALTDLHDVVTVIAASGNAAPVAGAGSDQSVSTGSLVQLSGAASSDLDGDAMTYSWRFVSLPQSSLAVLDDATAIAPSFVADLAGDYLLRLTVSDGFEEASDTVVVAASGSIIVPTRPQSDAGPDQNVVQGATVTLDGSDSSDPSNDPLTYAWSFLDWPGAPGTSPPALSGSTTADPSFVAAQAGDYVLRLVVNDGAEDSLPDTVRISAQAAGTCATPLNLVTALPFLPGLGEVASVIRIDGDQLSVVPSDLPAATDVLQAGIVDPSNPNLAQFVFMGPAWEEIARSHPNPVSDSASPWFVVRRTLDDVYHRIDVDFTGEAALLEVQIDALSGCRCGASAQDCPP